MEQLSAYRQGTAVRVNEFVRSVYNWMVMGLAITGLIAWYVSGDNVINQMLYAKVEGVIVSVKLLYWVLLIAELALVFIISGLISKMSGATATLFFLVYSALNGVTLSIIFLVYPDASLVSTLFICSATFLVCSIYGWTTKKDLTSIGSFLRMGVFGLIIAIAVNMFLGSPAVDYAISFIGVAIFIGLTAYDTQNLKNMAMTQPAGLDGDVVRKGTILGALKLYLDFINLFLFLLRIFGGSRD